MQTVQTAELRNTTTRHAFWRYYMLGGGLWVAHWGKIGTQGQMKFMDGVESATERYNKKLSDSYRIYTSRHRMDVADDLMEDFRQGRRLWDLDNIFNQAYRKKIVVPTLDISKVAQSLDDLIRMNDPNYSG